MKIRKGITVPFSESDILPYQTTSLVGEKVIVFAPHPDDETIGCGGTIAAHCIHGDQVKVIILTNGDKADTLNLYSREKYVEIRKAEAQQAGIILGVKDTEFWDYPDRSLKPDGDLVSRLYNVLNDYKPTLIYCPSPTEVHPDHRSTSQAVWKAILGNEYTSNKMAFYEVGVPFRPNTLVDITPYIEFKRKALKNYKSQQALNDYCNKVLGLNKYRTYTLSPQVEYAEGYYFIPPERLKTVPFDTLELCIFQPLPDYNLKYNTDERYLKLYSKHKKYINEKTLLQYTKTISASLIDKDRQIQSLKQSVFDKEKRIQSLMHSIEDKDILLNQVCSSLGWQLIDSIRRWINRLNPPGTKRRRWCEKVIKGIKFMVKRALLVNQTNKS